MITQIDQITAEPLDFFDKLQSNAESSLRT